MAPPADDSPDPLYTLAEVAKMLRMEGRTLRALVAEGEFPRPQSASKGIGVWSADDVLYYRLKMQLRHRLRPTRKPPKAPSPAAAPKRPPKSDGE